MFQMGFNGTLGNSNGSRKILRIDWLGLQNLNYLLPYRLHINHLLRTESASIQKLAPQGHFNFA
jgi:hypothetical protein